MTQADALGHLRKVYPERPAGETESSVRSAYNRQRQQGAGKEKKQKQGNGADIMGVQNWLRERYNGRYNVVTRKVELRAKQPDAGFIPADNRTLKSLWRGLRCDNVPCHLNDLANLLESDFSKDFNPFEDYLLNLPAWDGTDYIGQLADRVKTNHQTLWKKIFHKWFVGLIAGALQKGKPNHIMPVLRSDEQGIGKTSWCRLLLPPEWQAYLAENMPRPNDKDFQLLMASKVLILCDEMTQYERSADRYLLKSAMTQEVGTVRASYDRWHDDYPRRASFIGTTNDPQFLTDPTGNRRFCVVDVTEIDYQSPVNHAGCYAQGLQELDDGFVYWLQKQGIKKVGKMNEAYRVASLEEENVRKYFEKGKPADPNSEWLSAADVVDILSDILSVRLQKGAKNNVGKALHALGCKMRIYCGITQYLLRRRTVSQPEGQKEEPTETTDA